MNFFIIESTFVFAFKAMNQYVKYNSDYHVLICCQHGYGLAPDYIERHFRESHKTIPLETRRDIVSYSKTLDLWQPEQVNKSEPTFIPIQGLPIIHGFKCQYDGCGELRSTEISMGKHCREIHGWKGKEGPMWTRQDMQIIFQGPNRKYIAQSKKIDSRYFPVTVKETNSDVMTSLNISINARISEAEVQDKNHQKTLNQVRDSQSLVTKTPWLRQTRWEETFVGKDMATLVKLTNAPGIHDHQERSVWQATAGLIERCFKGILDCQERGWTLIPFWLRSVDRNKEDTKPFRTFIAPYTLRRYAGYWQQYILFCLRAVMTEDAVQFTVRQRDALLELNSMLYETDDELEIQAKILDLSILLIQHSDYTKKRSSLIYFTGVLGYNLQWKQWRQPLEYTTILAGLQFCIRVIMVEAALPTNLRNGFNETSVENPIQIFRKVRDIWLVDGEGIDPVINYFLTKRDTIWLYPPSVELWHSR